MDKRTFIFVISLSLTLLGVNLFFEWINQDNVKKWHEQNQTKLAQEKVQFETEVSERTAKFQDLPLTKLYTDDTAKDLITTGVMKDGAVIVLSWAPQLPENVYDQANQKLAVAYDPQKIGGVALYRKTDTAKLPITTLTAFGRYDLQIVTPEGDIYLGEYVDGELTIPYEKMAQKSIGSGIALLNETPVAIYIGTELIPIERIMALSNLIVLPKVKETTSGEEKFFVLENTFQQLVFSSKGGALSEINLPFKSEEDVKSVVKEIRFDRDMVENHPYNAYFPGQPFSTYDGEHAQGQLGGYYPLIRRNLIEPSDRKSVRVPPQFYALNIVSEYPEISELIYEVKEFTQDKIVFVAKQPHRTITKTYTLDKNAPYIIDLAVKIEGDTRGLWLTSGVPEVEWISGAPAPALKYRILRNSKSEINEISLPKETATVTTVYPDWIVTSNGFFGIILDPTTTLEPGYSVQYVPGTKIPSRLVLIDEKYNMFKAASMPGYMALLPLKSKNGVMKFRIFAGPFADKILNGLDKTFTDKATGISPDYFSVQSFHGYLSFISEPFAKFLYILMKFFHQITGSWGFSIILLTVALRLILYPLNAWFTRSTIKMQEIGPKMQVIQEKYKSDPKKLQLEMMNLYRESGANPLAGCLPMIIQLPFLMGMFGLLKTTFSLRGASFIPGWIDDLSAPDVLFSWDKPIFFIGTEFHLLPFILGAVMLIQPRLMAAAAPKDPSKMTDSQRQAKAMGNMMAIVFTIMFYSFPSGLNIYWLSSMLLGMLQQWWMQKRMKAKKTTEGDVIEVKASPVSKGKKKK